MNRFADFSRRHLLTASFICIVEVIFYREYAHFGAEFHFWLHGLFGGALGLAALTLWQLSTNRQPKLNSWEAGALGHLYSAVPDFLFIFFGILHMYWMDVFAIHISIHFIPAPVPTMLVVFLLTLVAYGLVNDGRRRLAITSLIAALVLVGVALLFRQPIPTNLQQLQAHNRGYAWLCPMWDLKTY
ncbi:MAG: hypothetical protein QFB87_02615 [Patescibacteria group bacterium]|nr:hypothetical protein [Patescibacteria group bacterium]